MEYDIQHFTFDFRLTLLMTAVMIPGAVEPIPKNTMGNSAKKYVKDAPTLPPMAPPTPTAATKLKRQTAPRAYLRSSISPPSAARFCVELISAGEGEGHTETLGL